MKPQKLVIYESKIDQNNGVLIKTRIHHSGLSLYPIKHYKYGNYEGIKARCSVDMETFKASATSAFVRP